MARGVCSVPWLYRPLSLVIEALRFLHDAKLTSLSCKVWFILAEVPVVKMGFKTSASV